MHGKFIVIDGMDGSGKGTQLALLRGALKSYDVLYTREPGGTPLAEEIREMLLRKVGPRSNPKTDFFLFWASRCSHVEDAIRRRREDGGHTITDRYDSSTFAFQIYGEAEHHLEKLFCTIRDELPAVYAPDAYIFLDLPAEVAYERRARDASQDSSRFDVWPLEKHQAVRDGFRQFAQVVTKGETKVSLVDANRTPAEVHTDIIEIILNVFAS